jgi:hypothetical protein
MQLTIDVLDKNRCCKYWNSHLIGMKAASELMAMTVTKQKRARNEFLNLPHLKRQRSMRTRRPLLSATEEAKPG